MIKKVFNKSFIKVIILVSTFFYFIIALTRESIAQIFSYIDILFTYNFLMFMLNSFFTISVILILFIEISKILRLIDINSLMQKDITWMLQKENIKLLIQVVLISVIFMSLDIYSIVFMVGSNPNFYITIITTCSFSLSFIVVLAILYTVFMYSLNKNYIDYIDESVYELLDGLALLHSDFILEFDPKINLIETQFGIYIKMYMIGVNNKIKNIFSLKLSNLLKINKQAFQPPKLLKY